MVQPYPRLCIHCGKPDINTILPGAVMPMPAAYHNPHPPLTLEGLQAAVTDMTGIPLPLPAGITVETPPAPRLGEWLFYTLAEDDARKINKRRDDANFHMDEHRANSNGVMVHVGNRVSTGDRFPALITRPWGSTPGSVANATVFLDGSDTYWATSRGIGTTAGTFQRGPRHA
jgi:hypothetical protein